VTFGALALAASLILSAPAPLQLETPAPTTPRVLFLDVEATVPAALLGGLEIRETHPAPFLTVRVERLWTSGARFSLDLSF